MKALDTNPATLARILEASDSTVRNYIYRETKPGYEVLEKLYRSFRHINLPWLFGEPGEPLLTGAGGAVSNNKNFRNSQAIGHVGRDAINNRDVTHNHDASARKLAAATREIELLKEQLADKERTIQILLSK